MDWLILLAILSPFYAPILGGVLIVVIEAWRCKR